MAPTANIYARRPVYHHSYHYMLCMEVALMQNPSQHDFLCNASIKLSLVLFLLFKKISSKNLIDCYPTIFNCFTKEICDKKSMKEGNR